MLKYYLSAMEVRASNLMFNNLMNHKINQENIPDGYEEDKSLVLHGLREIF